MPAFAKNVPVASTFRSGPVLVAEKHYGPTGSGWGMKSTCALTGPVIVHDQYRYGANYGCEVTYYVDERYTGFSLSYDTATCPTGFFTDPNLKDELLCTDGRPDDPTCVKAANGYCIGDSPKTLGCSACPIGNPINPSNGNKFQTERDLTSTRDGGLEFSRFYNSKPYVTGEGIGKNWRHTYSRNIVSFANSTIAKMYRADGKRLDLVNADGIWTADADVADTLLELTDSAGKRTGWRYRVSGSDDTELYDSAGTLLSITSRAGVVQTLTYSDGSMSGARGAVVLDASGSPAVPSKALPAGLLIKVEDSWNRSLTLGYNALYRVIKMTDATNQAYLYEYGDSGNLTALTYPDNKRRLYLYNESGYTGGASLPNALTGIRDENGERFATWRYDNSGAISSEHAGGAEKYSVNYTARSTTAIVTDPVNTQRTYSFQTVLGIARNTARSQPATTGSAAATAATTYDANGNVAIYTDYNGNVTTYSYDLTRNLETSRTEGADTAQARTITTQWHATYRLPLKTAEPKRIITFTYDLSGNLLTKTVQATADSTGAQGLGAAAVGTPRSWVCTYNTVGQVLTATGPRTDVHDTTRYAYDAATGNLTSVTNAAGHVTTLSNYDANGRVGKIVDANGLTTDMAYSPRGWLTSRTVSGNGSTELTSYDYDGVGQLKKVNLPDGSWIGYDYDDAHRLTSIYDSLGNRISYTLDAMGNRISEQVRDPSGALARQTTRVYDALNRLQAVTGAVQ